MHAERRFSPVGTEVGEPLVGVDEDGDALVYAMGEDSGTEFTLAASTGQLRVADGALAPGQVFDVQACVEDPEGLRGCASVKVAVASVADPPVIETGQRRSVSESATVGDGVGEALVASDADGEVAVVNSKVVLPLPHAGAVGHSCKVVGER